MSRAEDGIRLIRIAVSRVFGVPLLLLIDPRAAGRLTRMRAAYGRRRGMRRWGRG